MYKTLLIFLVFFSCSCLPSATVVKVYDGDSVTILQGNIQHKIRLKDIDAPELKQSYGQKSKEILKTKILNKKVQFKISTKDRYNREIADIWLKGENISVFMVEKGAAWRYIHYSDNRDLEKIQLKAKRNKTGLWNHPHPIPPWEWRKHDKN